MILLQIVMVSPKTHLVKIHEFQVQNQWVLVKKKMSLKLKMLGPLRDHTVNLKTDSKTVYYSLLKLKYILF